MAKIKETGVPLKSEKPRKAPKLSETARQGSYKSEEIVVESDSDDSLPGNSSGHGESSESDPEKRHSTKKTNLKKVAKTEPADPPVPESTSNEEEDDDDTDDSEPDVTTGQQDKPKTAVNGANNTLDIGNSDSDSSSDDDNSSSESNDPAPAPVVNGTKANTNKSSSSDDESSQGETIRKTPPVIPEATPAKDKSPLKSSKPQPYVPPPGYAPINTKHATSSTLTSLFPASSSRSKQIWHITAPAGVPLSELSSISLSSIETSKFVLSHSGLDFALVEDKGITHTSEQERQKRVLVPSDAGKGYAAIEMPITKTLHLQQVVKLPSLSKKQANPATGGSAAATVGQSAISYVRPQPKGLKMRYRPPGFGAGEPGVIGYSDGEESESSDVQMDDVKTQKPTFKHANGSSKSEGKRKSDRSEESPRKSKKRRAEKTQDQDSPQKQDKSDKSERKSDGTLVTPVVDAMDVDGENVEAPPAPSEEQQHAAQKAEFALAKGTAAEAPKSTLEKARVLEEEQLRKKQHKERKEEKRRKKEEKQKNKHSD